MKPILGVGVCLLLVAQNALAIMGGIPANPNQGNQGGQGQQSSPAAVQQAQAAAQAQAQSAQVSLANTAHDQNTAATQASITLRSLLLSPHDSWDWWANCTGSFNKENIATISSGLDYRLAPKCVLGWIANWTLGRHVDGSAMNFGPYTALSICGVYLIASELYNQEPETYLSFAQIGYVANLDNWSAGPFYAVQYSTKHDLIQNQAGLWANRSFGRLSPEIQVMGQNNCIRLHHEQRNSIWCGLTLNYRVSDQWFISAGYNIEANRHVQTNQVTIGFKAQF